MGDNKKISELTQIQSLTENDEFVVVDKSTTTGGEAGNAGKTTKVAVWQLKDALATAGQKGERGETGPQGAEGPKGDTGSQGPFGGQGARGATGATGATGVQGATGPKGDTGATGTTGDQGSTGPTGATGATGAKGDQGSQGATGPKGSTGAKGNTGATGHTGNSNAHLMLGGTLASVNSTGQVITKTSGGSSWNAQAYSRNSFANGAYVTFRPDSGTKTFMLGLNSDPTKDASYLSLDYAWYINANGSCYFREMGVDKGNSGTYSPTDIFSVTYDNNTVRWLHNGVVKRSAVIGAGKRFHLDSSLVHEGKITSMLAFGPMGPMGSVGAKGSTGATGAKGSTGAKGDTGANGATGATGSTGPKGSVGATFSYNSSTKVLTITS